MRSEHPPSPFGADYPAQQQMIDALRDPRRYPHAAKQVCLIETHISWVLLAGRYAYKIKKSVDFGFLDFTALDARRICCTEELRLNRRLAPGLYLDVVPIGGTPQSPSLGALPAIDYAVKMRRFAASRLMDSMLAEGLLQPVHIDRLAAAVARFHAGLAPAAPESPFGKPATVRAAILQNFDQLSPLLDGPGKTTLGMLRAASERAFQAAAPLLEQRRQQGMVRECHGDLHFGNIALLRGVPTPFDGIEFNADLRWIDVMGEIAFLVMDLLYHGRADLAFRLLNAYLEATGDYAGVGVLRGFIAYRALVRAKIAAFGLQPGPIRLCEPPADGCRRYLELAETTLGRPRPALILTHGLPGCGKTFVSQIALERLGAIRLRSDVERKRLYGLAPLQESTFHPDLYGAEATRRTYARLLAQARRLLDVGYPVIVDAAFLRRAERMQFRALTSELDVPFAILDVQANPDILRSRILQRMARASDASEANLAVLEKLEVAREGLAEEERAYAVTIVNEGPPARLEPAWTGLDRALERR